MTGENPFRVFLIGLSVAQILISFYRQYVQRVGRFVPRLMQRAAER